MNSKVDGDCYVRNNLASGRKKKRKANVGERLSPGVIMIERMRFARVKRRLRTKMEN